MPHCRTVLRGYSRSLAILSLMVGAAALCSAHPILWTINGTFSDGGTVTGTFVYDPDVGVNRPINTFNVAVSGGDTAVFFPYDFTPANSRGEGSEPPTGVIIFSSDNTYLGGETYDLSFVPASPLTDAGGVINLNVSSPESGNCFDCDPFRTFISGTITAATPPATPAPPSLLLILVGLTCAGLYAARHRIIREHR
jgi:hypothetical protein